MKKFIVLLTVVLCFCITGTAYAGVAEMFVVLKIGSTNAYINNESKEMVAPAIIKDNNTLVPLRFVGEAFGCRVKWDSNIQSAIVSMGFHTVITPIGSFNAKINGNDTPLSAPAQLINGNTYVPLRFIGESLGADVNWDGKEQIITISMKAYRNEDNGFVMILPSGWSIDEETEEGTNFNISDIAYCSIQKTLPASEGINRDNFTLFANEWIKEYDSMETLGQEVTINSASVVFVEDGLIQIHTLKQLENNDIYAIVACYPYRGFNHILGNKYDIVLNTIKSN